MPLAVWVNVLWVLEMTGKAALIVRLWSLGLDRTYRWFSWFLRYTLAVAIVEFFVRTGSTLYARIWFYSKPVEWTLGLLAVMELYALVMARYPGIATAGRWLVRATLPLAILVSVATLKLDFSNPLEKFPLLRLEMATHRTVVMAMALCVMLLLWFLLRFPIPLGRNVILHCSLYATYLSAEALGVLARNLLGTSASKPAYIGGAIVGIFCLCMWTLRMNRAGESTIAVAVPRRDAASDQALLKKLERLNAVLIGTSEGEVVKG